MREGAADPSRLAFEITESVIMLDPERITATLRSLHALGARIAVDDFGTGYSSLAYLHRLPLNEIKDGPLVRPDDARRRSQPRDRARDDRARSRFRVRGGRRRR